MTITQYQISTQDGNHVRHAAEHDDAMRVARAMADAERQTVLISVRGADEDDYETVEPSEVV